MPETQIQIGGIRAALGEFARKHKDGAKFRQENYQRKSEVKDVVGGSRIRYKSIAPLRDTGDFDAESFYGFCGDFE